MLVLSVLLVIVIFTISVYLVNYYKSRRRLYECAANFDGPLTIPIFGNAYHFTCKHEDIFDKILSILACYKHPMRFWLGPKLVLIFSKLDHVEKIMSSTKITQKSDVYQFVSEFGGVGLVTSSGEKWKNHRRLIQPLLSLKYATSNTYLIQKHVNIMLNKLDDALHKGYINILDYLSKCCFDILGEMICGVNVGTQVGNNLEVHNAFETLYENVFEQMARPWLYPKMLFNMSSKRIERSNILKEINTFLYKAIDSSSHRISIDSDMKNNSPIIDVINTLIQKDSEIMSRMELRDHVGTLYAASQDTTSYVSAMCCLCFGMYPEYQEIAAEEIFEVFGETPREVNEEDVAKLTYLDMCIKDVLRLAPIAPFILRKSTDDVKVGKYTIPPGCEILVPIFTIHRDPTQWEVPLHFYPNHFLPDAVRQRHSYSYLPFSAGPRNCVGKFIAIQTLKMVLANVLQRYKFEAEGKFTDLKFKSDISIRSISGYNVKLVKRIWTK